MRANRIEITKDNLDDYIGLDIIAFHWAKPGACGEHGGVVFITSDGNVYHTNYVFPKYGITRDDLYKIFPPLSDFRPGILGGGLYPDEWKDEYLGLGNYLVVHKTLWKDFTSVAEAELARLNTEEEKVILYNIWDSVVIKLL